MERDNDKLPSSNVEGDIDWKLPKQTSSGQMVDGMYCFLLDKEIELIKWALKNMSGSVALDLKLIWDSELREAIEELKKKGFIE